MEIRDVTRGISWSQDQDNGRVGAQRCGQLNEKLPVYAFLFSRL